MKDVLGVDRTLFKKKKIFYFLSIDKGWTYFVEQENISRN